MKIPTSLRASWLVLLATALLSACASLPDVPALADTQAAYDRHVATFNAANPHRIHAIKRADGHVINAREFSAPLKGKGATYVLMHGFPDNQRLYDLLIPLLAKTHHVVSFDFLGWGVSEKPLTHDYKVSSQRADLDAVIAAFDIQSAVIVVHDLSGQVGIDWALDNEAKTAELVLLNSYYNDMPTLVAPGAIEFYSKPGVLRDIARWGATKAPSRFKAGVANQMSEFMSTDAARQQFIPIFVHSAAEMRPAFFSSVAALWPEIAARANEVERMKKFAKPVRIVFGADDPFLNPGVAKSFANQFGTSCIQLLPKAGHYVQLDRPDAVARALQSPHRAAGACES
ncbi:MAG: alpha/beta hydrolase [Betaproteobacteria bacterium]|nr:MAG: alpha/beta hydrolase [Betaproteobacteria bacterium]